MSVPANMIHSKQISKNQLAGLNSNHTILLGIGNNGRRDDGLGWAFLEALELEGKFKGQIEYRYQLQVEDAALVSEYSNVIFVDAFHGELENGFSFEPTEIGSEFAFSTHVIPPPSILYLTAELYEGRPKAYTLAIEGVEWELKKGLSSKAKENLNKALDFFRKEVL